ncbi:MAG: hypothetical protein JNK04_00595 [Myxococcales bacterium]|nr:hypothetical protein [Myxococcales bacterium]
MKGFCYEQCVPDDPNQCPPGSHVEIVCVDDGSGMGFCYEECVPDDPNQCPPDTYLDVVCDEMGCYEVCVPYPQPDECPPGFIAVPYCDDQGCYIVCEEDGGNPSDPPQP